LRLADLAAAKFRVGRKASMRAEDHWEKSQHLENSRLRKLDPNADYELLIWSCIHGGAQLLNVILHRTGVTSDDYDMIHTSVPEVDFHIPDTHKLVFEALARIESLGPRFVRGAESWDANVGHRCLADYALVRKTAATALTASRPLASSAR
jgi:hypothetical protein